jgi:hypothetical protein
MSTLQEIEAAILGLSEQDRLHLADKILRSLPKPPGAMESEEILAETNRYFCSSTIESKRLAAGLREAFPIKSNLHPFAVPRRYIFDSSITRGAQPPTIYTILFAVHPAKGWWTSQTLATQ